ncbi:MAG: alpha/beta hydrolase [Chloroflexota bacterium]|nr:alpha/beta hydrolase [Chloroflexota bacterium]
MPTTSNGNVLLYYDVAGQGEPVLWLQGTGADHSAWTVQTIHFSRHFRCILPDNRDTGQSGRSPHPYDLRTLAEDALCVLNAAGERDAHVVGLSMGAGIAQELALLAPERVRSLALLSGFAQADARMRAATSLWPELYERLGRVMFHRHMEPWLFSPSFFEHPSNLRPLRRYVEQARHPQDAHAFARQVEASNTHDTRGRLHEIRARTLVVHGDQDLLVPPAHGRQLAEGIPAARFELRPGIAHSVNLEGQRPFNKLLEGFFSQSAAQGRPYSA